MLNALTSMKINRCKKELALHRNHRVGINPHLFERFEHPETFENTGFPGTYCTQNMPPHHNFNFNYEKHKISNGQNQSLDSTHCFNLHIFDELPINHQENPAAL